MRQQKFSYLLPVLVLVFTGLAFQSSYAQTDSSPFTFRQGQAMYIVAYSRTFIYGDVENPTRGSYQTVPALDAEQKVRKEFEKWKYFRVADKLSEADFIFLVNSEYSSMEGLAVPLEAYRQHFKEKFDIDALRDAAYGRSLSGPLKLPTLSRLSERLVKDFRIKIGVDSKVPNK